MELKEKKVLVFGAGISGIGAAGLLLSAGADVVLYEGNAEKKEADIRAALPFGAEIRIVIGELPEELMGQLDLTILSPGVPTDLPIVNKMREQGIRIWGEVELAWECGKGDVLAITGTNGKTTTTSLLV